tara:strand:- start:135 stop:308 length:174 start_codon:yes stop_codon:yes gene_type:complete
MFNEGIRSLDVSSDGMNLVFLIGQERAYTMNTDGSNLQEIIQNNIGYDFQLLTKVVF